MISRIRLSSSAMAMSCRSLNRHCSSSETLRPSFNGEQTSVKPVQHFATLLRNSTFIQMGDPAGKVVVGKIYHVVDDDLYVDFGGKFPLICTRPRGRNRHLYVRGAEVRLKLKRLEACEKFLGFEKPVSLLEADGILLGLK